MPSRPPPPVIAIFAPASVDVLVGVVAILAVKEFNILADGSSVRLPPARAGALRSQERLYEATGGGGTVA